MTPETQTHLTETIARVEAACTALNALLEDALPPARLQMLHNMSQSFWLAYAALLRMQTEEGSTPCPP